jgi:hypothetical protein
MNGSTPTRMIDFEASKLKFYSLGIVANNKALSSDEVEVTPIEPMQLIDGDIVSAPTELETSGVDSEGVSYTVKITADNAVVAKWLPMGSNRRTAPDVRRGERVVLYQYGDTDQFYWIDMGWDARLRKLETVLFSISGTQQEDEDSLAEDNCYSLEVSSHTQQITLRTSKANNEFCVYAFQFNLKEGRVLLIDELGNEILLDSKETLISLKNAENTYVRLDKKNIDVYAPDSISVEAVNTIDVKCTDFKLTASATINTEAPTTVMKANNMTLDASTLVLDTGSTEVRGTVTFKNAVTFEQQITANGISSSAPIQGPSDTI